MKVNFVIPSWSYWIEPTRAQPLTQMYLATILENEGHDIQFTDMRDDIKELPEADAHLYTVASPDYKEIEGIVKTRPHDIHIAGGPHINIFPNKSLEIFDGICIGKGEESVKKILKDIEKNQLQETYFMKTKGEYPFPKRHFLPRDKIVTSLFKTEDIPSTTAQFSHGCPYVCSFCANYNRGPVERRTPKQISDEIDYLKKEYGIEGLSLQDEICIPQKKQQALEWLALMKSKGIKWRGQLRAIDDEFLMYKAQDSGCRELSFGLESVDEDVLKMTGKNIKRSKVKDALRLAHKYDIKTRLYLVNGLPGEREDIVEQTIEFVERTNPDIVLLSSLQPYPGSPIASNPEKYGIDWINDDYTKYNHLKCRFGDNEDLDSVVPFAYKNGLSRQQIYNNLIQLQTFLRGRGKNK